MRFVRNWVVLNIVSLLFASMYFTSCEREESTSLEDGYEKIIVVVPDIQYYTNNLDRIKYLESIVGFCNNNQEKISFLLQTGDITNNNNPEQWRNGHKLFFSKLPSSFPVVFCLGNHDYGLNGGSAKRESFFPLELTPVRDEVMPLSQWDNYLRYVESDGKKMAILSLEFAPRNEVLEWADKIIKENSEIPIIILTHAFLNNDGQIFDMTDPQCNNQYSQKYYVMGGDYLNDSKEIFDKIIYNNSNVRMVICGHCISGNYIECINKKNATGSDVYFIMVNYQHYTEGGAGMIALLKYKNGCFHLQSYDTYNKVYGKVNISFDFKF